MPGARGLKSCLLFSLCIVPASLSLPSPPAPFPSHKVPSVVRICESACLDVFSVGPDRILCPGRHAHGHRVVDEVPRITGYREMRPDARNCVSVPRQPVTVIVAVYPSWDRLSGDWRRLSPRTRPAATLGFTSLRNAHSPPIFPPDSSLSSRLVPPRPSKFSPLFLSHNDAFISRWGHTRPPRSTDTQTHRRTHTCDQGFVFIHFFMPILQLG